MDSARAGNRPGIPGVHPKKDVGGSCAIALGNKRRERWHALSASARTAFLLTVLKALEQSVRTSQSPVSCSVLALRPTCSTPPGTATPNCLTSRLTSSNRGRYCRIAPAVMSLLHVMPTQTGRHFSPIAVRLDCKKSCQNSTGNAPGSSTILRQKAVMPFPNSSRPMLVCMMDCRWENR